MLSCTIVNGVMMEHESCIVANSKFRKNADKAVSISRTRHHDAVLALEKFAKFSELRSNTLVFTFDIFFSFFFFANNFCNSSEPFVSALNAIRLRSIDLRNAEGFFKCGSHVATQRIAEGSGRDSFRSLADFIERCSIQEVVDAESKRSKHFREIVRSPKSNNIEQVILLFGRMAIHDLTENAMECNVEARGPMLGTEAFAVQRNYRHANFRFHFFGDGVNIFTDNSGSASHANENSLGIETFLCITNRLTKLFRSTEHHVLFFKVGADVQSILQRLATTLKAHMHRKVEFGVFAAAADRRMVNQSAVREVAHLALDNSVGAHGFLVERRVQFAKLTAGPLACAATVLFRAAFVVGRFLDQVAGFAVPTDNGTQSIFAVFDRGHI